MGTHTLDGKRLHNLLTRVLEDAVLGAQVVALVKAAVPGQAKHAVLTQEQRRWLGNKLKSAYVPKLTKEELQYYQGMPTDSKDFAVLATGKVVAALGGEEASSSNARALPDQAAAAPQLAAQPPKRPVPQRAPQAGRKRKCEPPKLPKALRLRFGRKQLRVKSLAEQVLRMAGQDREGIARFVRLLVGRLDKKCPGLKQQLLRDAPALDNQLLRTLSSLREEAIERGFQTLAIQDIDFAISNSGTWGREFLAKEGYKMGARAWKTVQKRVKGELPGDRRAREALLRGGAPSKANKTLLDMTRRVLAENSKPGSRVAHVHRNEDGTYGQPRRRGSKSQEMVVPSQSLMSTPARLWQDHPELQQRISRSGFYKLLKQSFADHREGHRATDVCSHCRCYWTHIVPRFHRDWDKIQADLKAVYRDYFQHYPAMQHFADAGEEAAAALRYVKTHGQRYQQERADSGCDQLQLRTFTEGPAEVLLAGHKSMLQSYLWHMLSARR